MKNDLFTRLATWASKKTARPGMFIGAILMIGLWGLTGPFFHFGDTWQLVINTTTTIITFLMVFLIQNTQNRDTEALHIKLDELIRATQGAHNALMDLEELSEYELDKVKQNYEDLAKEARKQLVLGRSDMGIGDFKKR